MWIFLKQGLLSSCWHYVIKMNSGSSHTSRACKRSWVCFFFFLLLPIRQTNGLVKDEPSRGQGEWNQRRGLDFSSQVTSAKVRTIQTGARVWGETFTISRLIQSKTSILLLIWTTQGTAKENTMHTDIPISSLSSDLSRLYVLSSSQGTKVTLLKSIDIKVINVISSQHLSSPLIYNSETRHMKISLLRFERNQITLFWTACALMSNCARKI